MIWVRASRRFVASPDNIRTARAFVADELQQTPTVSTELLERARLAVSELATNAVLHGGGGVFEVVVETDPVVRITVADSSFDEPRPRRVRPHDTSGRGLAIVAAVADAWGVTTTPTGKAVWCELSESRA